MNLQVIAAILAALASNFQAAKTDAAAVTPKLETVSTALTTAAAVVASLPESSFKDEAVKALNVAGTAVATAVVVGHTIEASPNGNSG